MPKQDLLPADQRALAARLLATTETIPEADKTRPVKLTPEQQAHLDRLAGEGAP